MNSIISSCVLSLSVNSSCNWSSSWGGRHGVWKSKFPLQSLTTTSDPSSSDDSCRDFCKVTAVDEADRLGNRAPMSRWWNRVRHTPVLEELAAGLLDEVAEVDTKEDDGSLETISSDMIWCTGELMTLSSDTTIKECRLEVSYKQTGESGDSWKQWSTLFLKPLHITN